MSVQVQGIQLFVKVKGDVDYLKVGCLQSLGDIDFGTRDITEKGCMESDEVRKIVGKMKIGNMPITYTFDATNPLGNGVIKTAFDTSPAPTLSVKIELNDKATDAGTGTSFEFEAVIPSYKIKLPDGGEVEVDTVLEMTTKPTVSSAT